MKSTRSTAPEFSVVRTFPSGQEVEAERFTTRVGAEAFARRQRRWPGEEIEVREVAREAIYRGYSRGELRTAFDKICRPEAWKAPCEALVFGAGIDLARAAIAFFHGAEATVKGPDMRTMRYLVTSPGYQG